jgi:hypothetical protein
MGVVKLNAAVSMSKPFYPEMSVPSLEAFAATELIEIFSGRQLRQGMKFYRRFGTCWFGITKTVLVLPIHQHTLKMWIELVTETSV